MHGLELCADVLWRPTRLVIELEACVLGHFTEPGLFKRGREGLKELLVRLAEAVVQLVPGSPKGVCGGVSSIARLRVYGEMARVPPPVFGSWTSRRDV